MEMSPATVQAWARGLVASAPDADRADVCARLIGALAAELHMMIGGRDAAATLYGLADTMATTHIPDDGRG